MTLSGKDDLRHLTAKLDAKRLVRLAADVLWTLGHVEIRIVDGPGDGGRDVHAVAPGGQRVLAQCKFHENASKTCSSAELSELPMALTKLGYERGIFVTNAGISPQAKREYLDNYPNLNLMFVDGDELVRQVIQTNILKSIWFDGKELTSLTSSLSLPIIVREHKSDSPILPAIWDPPPDPTPFVEDLGRRIPGVHCHIAESHVAPHIFEPYRYPEPFASEEGMMPFLRAMTVSVRGELGLVRIGEVCRAVADAFGDFLGDQWQGFTIRIGVPQMTPLNGDQPGVPVDVGVRAVSFTTTEMCRGVPEEEFFGIEGSGWTARSDARTTEADHIRLFHPQLNVLASYEIAGRPSLKRQIFLQGMNESFMAGWESSVFALVPAFDKWEHAISEPDEKITWPWDGRFICAWFDGSFLSPLKVPRSINVTQHIFEGCVVDRTSELDSIRRFLAGNEDARLLNPMDAFHMVGSLGVRLVHEWDKDVIRTAEASHYPEVIPSPALPSSRIIKVTTAWKSSDDGGEKLTGVLGGCVPPMDGTDVDICQDGNYVVATWVVPKQATLHASTPSLLNDVANRQQSWLIAVEQAFASNEMNVVRDTREYWRYKHKVKLGLDPVDSDKVFSWRLTKDGPSPQVVGRNFDPSAPLGPLPEGFTEAMAEAILRAAGENE